MSMNRQYVVIAVLFILVALTWISCSSNGSTSTIEFPQINEPGIPEDFSTYESEGFFSISYPPDWEPVQSLLEELERYGKESVLEIDPSQDLDAFKLLFVAGKPTLDGWYPSVSVSVGKREFGYSSLDEIIESEYNWAKAYTAGYQEVSRTKTTIGGIEAYIIVDQDDEPGDVPWKYTSGNLVKGDYVWFVICNAERADYDEYEDEFEDIVRSFRILD